MSKREHTGPTPHSVAVDLAQLEGITVLGEPLSLLFSAMLRLQGGASIGGTCEVSATLLDEEAEAFSRAMGRSDREVLGDRRSAGERDSDRFVAVVERVSEVGHAVLTCVELRGLADRHD